MKMKTNGIATAALIAIASTQALAQATDGESIDGNAADIQRPVSLVSTDIVGLPHISPKNPHFSVESSAALMEPLSEELSQTLASPQNVTAGAGTSAKVDELSDDDSSSLKAGTRLSELTPNQKIIATTSAITWGLWRTASATAPIEFTKAWQEATDAIVCKGLPLLGATLFGQAQISAGRVDERTLNAMDIVINMGFGSAMAVTSTACSMTVTEIQRRINAESASGARKLAFARAHAIANKPPAERNAFQKLIADRESSVLSHTKKAAHYVATARSHNKNYWTYLSNFVRCGKFDYMCKSVAQYWMRHYASLEDQEVVKLRQHMTHVGKVTEQYMNSIGAPPSSHYAQAIANLKNRKIGPTDLGLGLKIN